MIFTIESRTLCTEYSGLCSSNNSKLYDWVAKNNIIVKQKAVSRLEPRSNIVSEPQTYLITVVSLQTQHHHDSAATA